MKKIVNKNGCLQFEVDGRTVLPAAYMSYSPAHADYDGFRRIGYRLFSYCVYAGDEPTNEENGFFRAWEPGCWRDEDTFDFSPLDAGMKRVLGDDPAVRQECYVILRINLNMPAWWRQKYPEELMHYAGGRRLMQSVASLRWRQDACVFLRKLKEHIDAAPYRENIIGWQAAAMQTEEWIHPSRYRFELEQETPCLVRFRAYCAEKYGDIAALNAAWGSAHPAFDAIPLPAAAQLRAKSAGGVAAAPCVRDFYTCLNEAYGEAISFFAAAIKALYGGDIFCGAFTGYIGQLQDFQGHNTVSRLLADPNIDFFASPFAYVDQRGPGVDWIYHSPLQTVTNAGKLWFLESDVRTCLTRHLADTRPDVCDKNLPYFNQPVFFGPAEESQSAANIVRSFAKFFISGHAYWWFDMWGGWYRSDAFMALHQKLLALYAAGPAQNNSQVAVVLDENASYGIPEGLYAQGVLNQLIELGYLGAPYDLLLVDSLTDADLQKYELFLFTCPDRDRSAYATAAARLAAAGKTVLVTGADRPFYDRAALLDAAAAAGVHIYSHGSIVYANAGYIAVTAADPAAHTVQLQLPCDALLQDVVDGSEYRSQGGAVSIPLAFNECRLLRLVKEM